MRQVEVMAELLKVEVSKEFSVTCMYIKIWIGKCVGVYLSLSKFENG
jgi:hypothetical protein